MFWNHRGAERAAQVAQVAAAWLVVFLALSRFEGAAAGEPAPSTEQDHDKSTLCPSPPAEPGLVTQIDPACDLRIFYPKAAHIGVALAVLPDPTVPRYRRIYDLSIQAIELGMLRDGYVLDRFYLPWNHSVRDSSSKRPSSEEAEAPKQTVSDKGKAVEAGRSATTSCGGPPQRYFWTNDVPLRWVARCSVRLSGRLGRACTTRSGALCRYGY